MRTEVSETLPLHQGRAWQRRFLRPTDRRWRWALASLAVPHTWRRLASRN